MSRQFFDTEGRFQIAKALDAHVMAAIVAAAPPFGTTGTTLVDKIRNGIATMRATGFNPNIVVLNPTDAATLDLTADAGGYVFPTRDRRFQFAAVGSACGGADRGRHRAAIPDRYGKHRDVAHVAHSASKRTRSPAWAARTSPRTSPTFDSRSSAVGVRQAKAARRIAAT